MSEILSENLPIKPDLTEIQGRPSADDQLTRLDEMNVFIKNIGWGSATQYPLKADASFRRYVRLEENGETALVMDAPPAKEDTRPFIHIAEHLKSLGFSAPEILAKDEENGFLLLEDFGEGTFTNLLKAAAEAGKADAASVTEESLYQLGTDLLIALHNSPEVGYISIASYSQDILQQEADLLIDWYMPALKGQAASEEERESYHAAWSEVYNQLPFAKNTLVLRDFHVDNLMLLPDRIGAARCGLLDFQDALLGHPAYDLMSLLEDARRDIPQDLHDHMLDRYFDKAYGTNRDHFMQWYAFLAAQRHAKVIGIFTRLYHRDGKDVYLRHIPRVCSLLKKHLANPLLAPIASWIDANLADFQQIPDDLHPKS